MTDRRDRIDAWLDADIEPLSPAPGTFERVSRRARRRKLNQVLLASAGAAVVIAGAVTLPRLTGPAAPSQLATATAPPAAHTAARPPATSHRGPALPSPSASPAGAPASGTALGQPGGPAPSNFQPTSVTFVSASLGAVIGQAGHRGHCGPPDRYVCTSLAGTSNYGFTWYGVSAPVAGPPAGPAGVSQLRFADQSDGWAFGPQLFATHDGGRSWARITALPGRVIDLEAVNGRAFALVARCDGTGQAFARGCDSFRLFVTPTAADQWRTVPGASAALPVAPGDLQLTQQRGYLLAGGLIYTGAISGGSWRVLPVTAAGYPACLNRAGHGTQPAQALISPEPGELFVVCSVPGGRPVLYASADGGVAWRSRGPVTAGGTANSLSSDMAGTVLLATTSGLFYAARGQSWQPARLAGGEPSGGFSYVGMTNTQQGVAVPADPRLHEIFITADGGASWQPRVIP